MDFVRDRSGVVGKVVEGKVVRTALAVVEMGELIETKDSRSGHRSLYTPSLLPHLTLSTFLTVRLTASSPRLPEYQLIMLLFTLSPRRASPALTMSNSLYWATMALLLIEKTRMVPSTVIEMIKSSTTVTPRQMLVC